MPPSKSSEIRLHVAGMDCADEAALIRHALAGPGILSLNFDLVGRRVDVTFNPDRISAAAILAAVGATGLTAHTHDAGDHVGDDHAHHDHHHDPRHMVGGRERRDLAGRLGDRRRLRRELDRCGVRTPARTRHRASSGGDGRLRGLHDHRPLSDGAARRGVAAFLRLDMHVLVCLRRSARRRSGSGRRRRRWRSCSRLRT